ncbi:MAG TPA: hypothetical protein VFK23_04005 [Nitrospirota bacterium]|nr:hypothetical protein [Nitrospirota bacterium]
MNRSVLVTILLCVLLVSIGCASMQVKQVWIDETYQGGQPKNVLIIAVMRQPTTRRMMESEFVKHFKMKGIGAVESFRALTTDTLEGDAARDGIVAAVKDRGIDAVLTVRSAGSRIEERNIPGMTITTGVGMPYGSYGAWGGYTTVMASFPEPSSPTTQGYSAEQKFLSLETQLYDVRTEKLIWSALSEMRISGPPQEEIKDFVSLMSRELFRAKPFR